MVQAFTVVTVQEMIFVPNKGENCGKIGFLITNSVLAATTLVSLPTYPEVTPNSELYANKYVDGLHSHEAKSPDPGRLLEFSGQGFCLIDLKGQKKFCSQPAIVAGVLQ
jgi:hypothetical protein